MDTGFSAKLSSAEAALSWNRSKKQSRAHAVNAVAYAARSISESGDDSGPFWSRIEQDCNSLDAQSERKILPSLWGATDAPRPNRFSAKSEAFIRNLQDWGDNWNGVSNWFERVVFDPLPTDMLYPAEETIAKKPESWWGRNPDEVAADIREELILKIPMSDTVSGEGSAADASRSSASTKVVEQLIARHPKDVLELIDGLIVLVESEKASIEQSPTPNHPEAQDKRQGQLDFLSQLLNGLSQIRELIQNGPSKNIVRKIDKLFVDLEAWFIRQPNYVQASVKLTGVWMATAGLVKVGALWLASFSLFGLAICKYKNSSIQDREN